MAVVIRLLGGLGLWAGGFSLLYGLHGIGCAAGWDGRALGPLTLLGAVLIACWLALLAAAALFLLALARRGPQPEGATLGRMALLGAWAGLAGLAFTGAPVLLPAHCL